MKLRPCQAPDWRVTGARPAKLATALASRRPSSGIWVSRSAAVMLDTPGIEVRIDLAAWVRAVNAGVTGAEGAAAEAESVASGNGNWVARTAECVNAQDRIVVLQRVKGASHPSLHVDPLHSTFRALHRSPQREVHRHRHDHRHRHAVQQGRRVLPLQDSGDGSVIE